MQNESGQGPAGGNWAYHPDDTGEAYTGAPQNQPAREDAPAVTWTASEFIAHHKSSGWYTLVSAAGLLIAALAFFFTKDIFSVVAIIVVMVLFMIISAAQPNQKTYTVDRKGVRVGDKLYTYDSFKSFSVRYEGAIGSISFMPLRRFMPELSIYFAPDDEHRIIDVLASYLPNDQRPEHGFDSLIRKIRF